MLPLLRSVGQATRSRSRPVVPRVSRIQPSYVPQTVMPAGLCCCLFSYFLSCFRWDFARVASSRSSGRGFGLLMVGSAMGVHLWQVALGLACSGLDSSSGLSISRPFRSVFHDLNPNLPVVLEIHAEAVFA